MYQVVIPRKARKDLKKIDQRYKTRLYTAFSILANDPFIGKKLEGEHRGRYSYRVWPYRIVYAIRKHQLVIIIIRVGHWQGVYK